MKRTKLEYHPSFTHWLSGRMFNLRPRRLCFERYCLFVCFLICLFVCVYHGSDITTCIKFDIPLVLFVYFVALRPKSIAMVMVGRSVHLSTLFPGQA